MWMLMADILMARTKGWATFLAKHTECQSLLQEKILRWIDTVHAHMQLEVPVNQW